MALARSTKRQAVEASVLRATEELLEEGHSYADLNVERIASRAGISRTAFYFYFRDKRELLMRLTADVSELLYAEAEQWFAGGEDDPAPALRKIGALYREHAALLRAIVEVSTYDEEVATFWRALIGRFVEATEKRVGSRATAFALVWMTERTFYQQLVQGRPLEPAEHPRVALPPAARSAIPGRREPRGRWRVATRITTLATFARTGRFGGGIW